MGFIRLQFYINPYGILQSQIGQIVQSVQSIPFEYFNQISQSVQRIVPDDTFAYMLSKIIRERIEQRFGQPIRYSKDCEALSASISKQCKANISPSTLKRLFGFNQSKQTTRPRLYTLDVLSSYLGHATWNDLIKSLNRNKGPEAAVINHITSSDLSVGEEISVNFNPAIEFQLKYKGNNLFDVTLSTVTEVVQGDTIALTDISLHYPLFISKLTRDGHEMGDTMIGDISGITSIKKLKKRKS